MLDISWTCTLSANLFIWQISVKFLYLTHLPDYNIQKKKKKTVVGETEQVIRRQKADIVLIHSAYQTERTMNNVVYRFHRYIRMTVAKHLFHVRCRKLTHFFFFCLPIIHKVQCIAAVHLKPKHRKGFFFVSYVQFSKHTYLLHSLLFEVSECA